uniref:Retrovirus-related Pol polyprotein from transposon TNT 1-94 n=1 Tax=Cajanus cajan TaxID=3821 RepID=A0A151QSG1_CAJCA|nr:Retrovirus-related Pol polyprotein from transposon TNT 1-94 [Cajanus cajan]
MWDTLQVTHEGTSDVKRSRKHTLIREYELLRMNHGESISDFQKRFTHLINHLVDLGRKFEEEELNLKVLQCLDRSWQAKVTAIEESKDLTSLTLATLFGKLREHEQKLHIFEENEQQDKKGKGVKFLRKKRSSPYKFNKKANKKEEGSTSSYNCFECGKPGHIKAECPNLLKKQQEEKKGKKNYKGKRAYIAWEDNDSSTTSDESEFEENNLCLMAGADQDTIVSDSDLESNPDYDQLQEAFIQIHKEAVKLDALNSKLKNKLSWYENALIRAEQELENLKNEHENLQTILNFNEAHCETSPSSKFDCENCKVLEKENDDLKNSLAKFTKGNENLNIILGKQRHAFDRSGLGFNQSMNMPLKSKERVFNRNQSFRKYKGNFIKQTTCFYCCKKGHTIRNCYSKKYGVPNGEMIWIKKSQRLRTNHQGPFTWVPKECLRAKSLLWYLDSGCSRHMTGDPSKFSSLKLKNEGFVTYGDNNKGKILGHGNIGNSSSSTLIENVLLVEGLKHNLLSISQLSDKGFKIEFDNTCCLICDKLTKEIRLIGKRIDNIYMLDLEHSITISNTVHKLEGNYYGLVMVDNYLRFTWVVFLANKSEAFNAFKKFAKLVQNEKNTNITSIGSDHGGEFQNILFQRFYEEHGINHNFSAPRTPQQNGVVERKNRSLEELARTMLNETKLPKYFWADAINTTCHVLNKVLIRPILKRTPYEIYNGRKPNISYFTVFGCKCFVLNNGKEQLGKFDAKADEAIFLGYSTNSKAYKVYNKRTLVVEESVHVVFDETNKQETK